MAACGKITRVLENPNLLRSRTCECSWKRFLKNLGFKRDHARQHRTPREKPKRNPANYSAVMFGGTRQFFAPPFYPKSSTRLAHHDKALRLDMIPDKFNDYDEDFEKITSFEAQMASLEVRGFSRPYKPYSDCAKRFDGHAVPNSLLHVMDSVSKVVSFYSTGADCLTPYDALHEAKVRGELPPNLHIKLESNRFDGTGGHRLNEVTAFPRQAAIVNDPEAKRKYPPYKPEHSPWPNI
jgi:hypothetical protein